MIHPPLKEFIKLTRKGNVIPVYQEINADLETPVSAFLKVAQGDYAFLLESVEGQEKIARFSFLGSSPSLVFKAKGRSIEISEPAKKGVKKFTAKANPIAEVKKIMRDFKAVAVKGLPRFCGGLVGFIGYDTVRFFEGLPDKNPDNLKTPDALLMLADTLLVFDHVNHNIKIVSNVILPQGKLAAPKAKALYNRAVKRIEEIQAAFSRQLNENEIPGPAPKIKFSSNFKKSEFENVVRQAKRYIKKGDIIQVVPSQRFKVATAKDPFLVYRKLRSLNPSPYMYFLRLKDMHLVGASPEMLVRCEDGLIQTRPIAGTRPRGKNAEEDTRLARELINDEKERAEHLMLVDLGRNDLGRVSATGTVEVSEFMGIEKYSHVMHLVSEVKGKLDNKRYDIY
ncbi:MAG: chorismate-binding protein, partial [Candidatus Omnitrophota bacterium]